MLLKKIKLRNFRQYYDCVEINFAYDLVKNVTLIHAENGVGKTALLNAIKWCFYGKFTNNFRNPNDLINFEALKEGKKSCSVEIEFEEANQDFLVMRKFDGNTKKSELKLMEGNSGVWKGDLSEPELVINSMLPQEMSDYFFFQGEGSNAVEVGRNGSSLSKSIKDILGFKVAGSLSEFLKRAQNETQREIAKLDTTGKATEKQNVIDEKEKELEAKKALRMQCKELIPELKERLEVVEEQLSQIKNFDLTELRSQETKLNDEKKELLSQADKYSSQLRRLISTYGWAVFGFGFSKESLDFIDENEIKGRLPEPYNQTFIEELLAGKECICGAPIHHGSDAFCKIKEMLGRAANPMLQNRLIGIRYQLRDISTLNKNASTTISSVLEIYHNTLSTLEQTNKALQNINEKIAQLPVERVRELQKAKSQLVRDIEQQQRLDGGYSRDCEILTSNLQQLRSDLVKLLPQPDIMFALQTKSAFLGELNEYLINHLDKIESSVRLHILNKVNNLLLKFSRHSYKIKTDSDGFHIRLVDTEDNIVGQGDGLNLLLNLTITAALIEFVDERKNVRDPLVSSCTTAPLVIDAPFGVLDDLYRTVVVSELPKHVRQVMFFVSTSQWREDMDKLTSDRIGSRYVLVLEEKEQQGGRTPDYFTVDGERIIANRYGCQRNRVLAQDISK